MSRLLGAWATRGLARVLDGEARARMEAHGRPEREVHEDGRLWIGAAPDRIRRAPLFVAAEGFLAGDDLEESSRDARFLPEGHYVLVRRDTEHALTLHRSLSGGERLYFTQVGDLVLFASSVRPLLAHPRVGRRLDPDVLAELLLSGLVLFGDATSHAGIREVLPGCSLTLTSAIGPSRCVRSDALRPPEGAPEAVAKELRERLTAAVVRSAGRARPVLVALSGGIDSSAIAAAAVDAFGADQVRAITYEFQDPTHSSELDYARLVAGRLGIRDHHVFSLTERAYLEAIPEAIWRNESFVHWPKAFMLLVAREVRRLGHDRYLTGFGIGSHTAFLLELGEWLGSGLRASPLPLLWRRARFGFDAWPDRVGRAHPALEPPHPRLYYLLVRHLVHAGHARDVRRFFPRELWPLLSRPAEIDAREPELAALPLPERLVRSAFTHLVSCIDVTRSEKASRELGVSRISPAHFASCLPYAYFPIRPRPRLYSEARKLRPGKLLLRTAFAGAIPDEVLYRVKSWGDAVASDRWLRAARRAMLSVLPSFPADMDRHGAGYADAVRAWEPRSILATSLAFRLWERIFIEMPITPAAPSWNDLWAYTSDGMRRSA